MFNKFKKKDKQSNGESSASSRSSHKLISTRSSSSSKFLRSQEPVPEPKPAAKLSAYEEAQQQRIARFNSTSTTMMSDDVEDVFYARGGTEVFVGSGNVGGSTRSGTNGMDLSSTRSNDSSMSYDDDNSSSIHSNYSNYSGYSNASSTRSTDTYRSTNNSVRVTENLRATGLETLNELEEEVVDRSTAKYVGAAPSNMVPMTRMTSAGVGSPVPFATTGNADGLQAELAQMREEMQAIKREMMNEMHLTRYDVLKEVTMLKGTIMQLVSIIQQTGGAQFEAAAATVMGVEAPPQPTELSTDEKEAMSRRTTTVSSKGTKERITTTREDLIPPLMRASSRLTQLAPVADSALSTPLNQEQIDDLFPLLDFSAEVQIQSKFRETGSRDWAFDRVQEWLDSRFNVGSDNVLAIVGGAGVGKTVVAASISDKHHEQVVAQHFCKFDRKAKSSPRNVLLSVVNQLTTTLPTFKSQLARLNLKYVMEETDVLVLARKVLVDPLNSVEEPLTSKFVVLDGLDQVRGASGYNDLLDFLSTIIPECPNWLGFLITSKPSPEFAATLPVSSVLDFSCSNPSYVNDTVFLVNDIISVFHDNDQKDAKEILTSKSGGNYSYLEFTKQALSNPGMEDPDGFIPVDILHDLPQTLYEIYEEIFEDKFGKGRTRLWRKALPVLQLIFTAASGPYAQITEQHIMDSLSYSKDEIRMLRRAFIDVISIRHGTYHIVSSAIYDWLTDPQRKGEAYHVDVLLHVKVLRRVLSGEKLQLPGTASNTSPRNTPPAHPSSIERSVSRSAISTADSTTSSSSSSGYSSNSPSTGGARVVSTVQAPVRKHEPNLNPRDKPVGILKRHSSRA